MLQSGVLFSLIVVLAHLSYAQHRKDVSPWPTARKVWHDTLPTLPEGHLKTWSTASLYKTQGYSRIGFQVTELIDSAQVSPDDHEVLWVEVQSHFIDTLQVWFVAHGKDPVHYILTRQQPIPEIDVLTGWWHHYFLFPIPNIPEGKLYLQGYNPPPKMVKMPIKARSMPQLLAYLQSDHWGWALFMGAMCMCFLLGATGYLFYRQRIYFYYIGYIFSLSAYALLNDGWGIYLPSRLSFLDDSTRIGHLLNISFCFVMLFSKSFLMVTDQPEPRNQTLLARIAHFCCQINPVVLMLGFSGLLVVLEIMQQQQWYTAYQWTYRIGLVCLPLYFATWLAYVWDALQRDFRAAWLLVGAVAILFSFYFYSLLVNLGWIAAWIPDMAVLRVGVVADVSVIGIAWVYRQHVLDRAKNRLEQENKEKAEEIIRAVERQQQNEIQRLRLLNETHTQRERLACNLHDGIGSQMAHIIGRLDMLEQRSNYPSHNTSDYNNTQWNRELSEKLKSLVEFARETNSILRQTIWVLNQSQLKYQEMADRIRHWLFQVWDGRDTPRLHTSFEGDPKQILSPILGFNLLVVCKEAVTNALRHAQATQITLAFRIQENILQVEVSDDGQGIAAAQQKQDHGTYPHTGHYGLINLQKRCEEMGGHMELVSDTNGTKVTCFFPITESDTY